MPGSSTTLAKSTPDRSSRHCPVAWSIRGKRSCSRRSPRASTLPPCPTPNGPRSCAIEPDQIELRVAASAPAILVLSEVWDPGWSATVDGQSAQVLLADYALRGVPIPQGNHTVILRYDPPLLRIGLVISATTALLLVGAAIWSKSQASRGPKFDWKWLR